MYIGGRDGGGEGWERRGSVCVCVREREREREREMINTSIN